MCGLTANTMSQGAFRSATASEPGSVPSPPARWHYAPAALAVALVALLVVPRLPPGVCFDDSGDLQTACRLLRPAHDPGYAGYVTLGWFLTRLPGANPAFVITLTCCVCGLLALGLCIVLQLRLGVHPLAAAAVTLLCALHPAIRHNLAVPEVYAPTTALLLGAVVCMQKGERAGHLRHACLAMLLVGLAAGSRPPVLLMLPGFVIGLWALTHRPARKRRAWFFLPVIACLVLPCLYAPVFLWWREPVACDTREHPGLVALGAATDRSEAPAGRTAAVLRRLTGANYGLDWSNSWEALKSRAVWVAQRSMPGPARWLLLLIVPLVVTGLVRTARWSPTTAWSLFGVLGGALALLLLVHTDDAATDYMPVVLTCGVACGTGLSPRTRAGEPPALLATRYVLFVAALLGTVLEYRRPPDIAVERDATDFLHALDVRSLPPETVIITPWFEGTAIRYACADTRRGDIEVVCAQPHAVTSTLARFLSAGTDGRRLVLLVGALERASGCVTQRFRNVWRVEHMPPPAAPNAQPR